MKDVKELDDLIRPTLDNLNAEFPKGKLIGVIGPVGAGKYIKHVERKKSKVLIRNFAQGSHHFCKFSYVNFRCSLDQLLSTEQCHMHRKNRKYSI